MRSVEYGTGAGPRALDVLHANLMFMVDEWLEVDRWGFNGVDDYYHSDLTGAALQPQSHVTGGDS